MAGVTATEPNLPAPLLPDGKAQWVEAETKLSPTVPPRGLQAPRQFAQAIPDMRGIGCE